MFRHLDLRYFQPLSWNNGNGDFVEDDSWMLHKALFQYLCRLLSFLLVDHTPPEGWRKEHGYVYYLRGHDRWGNNGELHDYRSLFNAIVNNLRVEDQYTERQEEIRKLVSALDSMYRDAYNSGQEASKCGVFCGSGSRLKDN